LYFRFWVCLSRHTCSSY
jgi:hypothetical protein